MSGRDRRGPAFLLVLPAVAGAAACRVGGEKVEPEETSEVWDALEEARAARNPAVPPPEEKESARSELLDVGADLFLVVGLAALLAFALTAPRSRATRALLALLLVGGAVAAIAWSRS